MRMPRRLPALCYLSIALCLFSSKARAQWQHKIIGPTSLAFSPDGRWLAAGSIEDWVSPGDLLVWEAKSGKLLHKVRYVYGVQSLAFAPNGKTLAVATYVEKAKDAIRLWNMRSWRTERTLGERLFIYSIAFSPDGAQLAAGSDMAETGDTEDAYLLDLPKRRLHVLPHSNGLAVMFFSPRNHFLLGAYYSGYYNDDSENLRAWDTTGHFLWRHQQPRLTGIAFMPDGRTFIAGVAANDNGKQHAGGALQIWDTAKGRLLQTIKRPESVAAVAVTPDGKMWATGDSHGIVRLWNAQTRHVVKTLSLHRDIVRTLVFSPDGHFLASSGGDDYVRLTVVP